MSQNYITIDDTLNSNVCLSFYKPDLNDFKLENENNLKRQQEKFNILKEILSSEKKYLNDIKEIVEGYYEEIKKSTNEDFVYHIFSNIKEIYEFTKSFYMLLEASTNDEVGIANCFIKKHKSFLRLYSLYCQNYKLALSTTEKLEREHNTAKLIQKVRLKYGHCLKMATYLQLPVLRITKYHLLLQRYLKLLDKETPEHNKVLEALELMKQVNDQINNNMPLEDLTASTISLNENLSSTVNIQNLVKLFGSILKQGNLIFAQTKKLHYVIVFQSMLIIKKSGQPNKILHSISNECLAFLPSSFENKSKYFTIIDYSQPKEDDMWEFTFKAKTFEEKQTWQSSILSCMLSGYGKKISDNVKTKVMKIDSCSDTYSLPRKTSNEIIRKKLANIRRLTDFRGSLKHEYKEEQSSIELNKNLNQDLDNRRRMSTPLNQTQSKLNKLLDRTIYLAQLTKENGSNSLRKFLNKQSNHKTDLSLENIFAKFRAHNTNKENTQTNQKKPIEVSTTMTSTDDILDFSDNTNTIRKKSVSTETGDNYLIADKIEIERRNSTVFSQNCFETSFEEIAGCFEDNLVFNYENLLNRNLIVNNNINTTKDNLNKENLNSDTSSKSSINSEEGYYSSNQDSSQSTLVVENQTQSSIDNSTCTLIKNKTYSTPDLLKQFNSSKQINGLFEAEPKSLECKNKENFNLNESFNHSCQTIDRNVSNNIKITLSETKPGNGSRKVNNLLIGNGLNHSLFVLNSLYTQDKYQTKKTRINNLKSKFESLNQQQEKKHEYKSNSFNVKSKSINELNQVRSRLNDEMSNSQTITGSGQTEFCIIDNDDNESMQDPKPNVKDLIIKFENKNHVNLKSSF